MSDLLEPTFPEHYAAAVIDPTTGKTLNYWQFIQNLDQMYGQ
jgi:hypothetical protein